MPIPEPDDIPGPIFRMSFSQWSIHKNIACLAKSPDTATASKFFRSIPSHEYYTDPRFLLTMPREIQSFVARSSKVTPRVIPFPTQHRLETWNRLSEHSTDCIASSLLISGDTWNPFSINLTLRILANGTYGEITLPTLCDSPSSLLVPPNTKTKVVMFKVRDGQRVPLLNLEHEYSPNYAASPTEIDIHPYKPLGYDVTSHTSLTGPSQEIFIYLSSERTLRVSLDPAKQNELISGLMALMTDPNHQETQLAPEDFASVIEVTK